MSNSAAPDGHLVFDNRVFVPLKKRGRQGMMGAAAIMIVVFLIIVLSKLNDVRHYRVPWLWRRRIRKLVMECAEKARLAAETNDFAEGYHNAIEAEALLHGARQTVGDSALHRISGMDVAGLEGEIERLVKQYTVGVTNEKAVPAIVEPVVTAERPRVPKTLPVPDSARGRSTRFTRRRV